jgi:hypothetical protein
MATTDFNIPVSLIESADEYISKYGSGTAVVSLTYGSASPPADGTASLVIVSGTERYDFWVTTPATSYFQWRVGAGTAVAYESAVFQVPTTYATLDEVVRGMDFPDTSRYDELQGLLVQATDYITNRVCGGRSFFRDPVSSGTKSLTLDVEWGGQSKLSLARGRDLDIISLTTVEVADYTGYTYTTVASGDTGYYLLPDYPRPGFPYSDIVLSDQGDDFTNFPKGRRIVRLTGAFGWETVPELVRRATVDLVRHWFNSRGSDDPVGMSAFGAPIFPGMPRTVRELAGSEYAWRRWVG